MTAAAIAPSTTPPATTESNVFFKDGVTEASANKGEVIDVITAADIAALAFDLTFSTFSKLNTVSEVEDAFADTAKVLPCLRTLRA